MNTAYKTNNGNKVVKMPGKYALAILCDDNYLDYAYAMLTTFIQENKWFDGDLVVISDNKYCVFSDKSLECLRNVYPKVVKLVADSATYESIIENSRDKVARQRFLKCYYKYEVFDLNRYGYDRVLFLDCDVLVFGDLTELFSYDADLIFTHDYIHNEDFLKEFVIDMRSTDKFNTGVFSVRLCGNTQKIREKLIEYTKNCLLTDFGNAKELFAEQDVMNSFFQQPNDYHCVMFPKKYNCANYFEGTTDIIKKKSEAFLHVPDLRILHMWAKPSLDDYDGYDIVAPDDLSFRDYFWRLLGPKYGEDRSNHGQMKRVKGKKCAVMAMYSNSDGYRNEMGVVRNTWAKHLLNNDIEDIDAYFFTAWEKDEIGVDIKTHTIHSNSGDKLYDTYDKMMKAVMAIINRGYEWFIFTNVSTFINIRLLKTMLDEDVFKSSNVYGGHLIYTPYYQVPFFRGDFIMIHHSVLLKVLTCTDYRIVDKSRLYGVNDGVLGLALFNVFGDNYVRMLNEVPHIEKLSELKFDNSFATSLYVRCKDKDSFEKTNINMTGLYAIYMSCGDMVKECIKSIDRNKFTYKSKQIDSPFGRFDFEHTSDKDFWWD